MALLPEQSVQAARLFLPQVCRNEIARPLTLAKPLIQRVERPRSAGIKQIPAPRLPSRRWKLLILLGNSWGMV
jgi:hypothetical protein